MASWLNNAIFYEVYPQSFNDTNSDGIGDFQGIINKLDYISNLGCNAIWINPCFDSSFYDAGYDVRDYYATAERYGTNEDLHCAWYLRTAHSGQPAFDAISLLPKPLFVMAFTFISILNWRDMRYIIRMAGSLSASRS